MLAVPREAFVPQDQRALAYLDLDLDVSEGASAKRYLIKPVVTAKMLQAAEIKDTDKVLVVGCATGYAAAVVARLAGAGDGDRKRSGAGGEGEGGPGPAGLGNVTVRAAEAADGDPANAPYDVIVLNGATEVTPDRLYGQLRDGGRLVGVFRHDQALAGHDRDTLPRRFWHPGAFRRVGAGFARPWRRSRLRFLALRRHLKSRSKSEVWPGCPTSRVSVAFRRRGFRLAFARNKVQGDFDSE